LGLQFDPVANEIRLRNPRLPSFVDELVLRNLQLKQSSVDLKVRRHANEVSVEILERRGQAKGSGVFNRFWPGENKGHWVEDKLCGGKIGRCINSKTPPPARKYRRPPCKSCAHFRGL